MTQVKEMTNPELNRKLAELLGRWIGDCCTDPAASLEVQAAAIAANKLEYLNNLLSLVSPGESIEFGLGGAMEVVGYNIDGTAALLTASPRERAEAAWMTLSQKE